VRTFVLDGKLGGTGRKSARRMRTRRPTCRAGSFPASIQFLTVCWFGFRIVAISATVMKSSDSGMHGKLAAKVVDTSERAGIFSTPARSGTAPT
jgi:hypothetical protein